MRERYSSFQNNVKNDADVDFPMRLLDKDKMISQLAF